MLTKYVWVRSVGLWRRYINVTITVLVITHRPVFSLKHNISETGLCLHLRVEPTQLCPIDEANLCLWTPATTMKFIKSIQHTPPITPRGGGLEYLHRCPASCKRRHKGNPVPGGITGPPCSWGIRFPMIFHNEKYVYWHWIIHFWKA
jgi:hypothetical protein